MPALLYIHGFISSPLSHKAQQLKQWLAAERADIAYHCPFLSPHPSQARQCLDELSESLLSEPLYLMGSSLGGFWATYLAEKYRLRAVLINPAVKPYQGLARYIDKPLKNYHTDEVYHLTKEDIGDLRAAEVTAITHKKNYWLMVQRGDEVLDYRDAVAAYEGCQQLVEAGGDHSFQQFARWIPAAIDFLEQPIA